MASHTTALSFVRSQEARFKNIVGDGQKVVRMFVEGGESDLRQMTSGALTPEQTKGAYARGASAASNFAKGGSVARRPGARRKAPLRPINKQSGRLNRSVHVKRLSAGIYDLSVGKGVPHAKYVLHPAGTKFMVGRGVMSWNKVGKFPMGELEKRHRLRTKALRNVMLRSARKP